MFQLHRLSVVFAVFGLMLIVVAGVLNAQDSLPVISFDPGSKKFEHSLPFDVPFFIHIPLEDAVHKVVVTYKSDDCEYANFNIVEWTRSGVGEETAKLFIPKLCPDAKYRFTFVCLDDKKDTVQAIANVEGSNDPDASITLDLGLGRALPTGSGGFEFTYAALNIAFAHINPKASYSLGDFTKRLAFTVGISLGGVGKEGERSDLMSSDNSLLVGLSYRVLAGIKLSGGALLYKKLDEDGREISTSATYISLSAGSEIAQLAGIITGLFE